MATNTIPDGLKEIAAEMPIIMKMIARTSRWVHPDVFKALPVWRPDTARNQTLYKSDWMTPSTNKGASKVEGNTNAQNSLMAALGIVGRKPPNWTTCHIWGYDDSGFVGRAALFKTGVSFRVLGIWYCCPRRLRGSRTQCLQSNASFESARTIFMVGLANTKMLLRKLS